MDEKSLHRIVYVSTATEKFSDSELESILAKSRSNNEAKNITGLLIYSDGNILQILEGNKTDLENLYSVIHGDPRHFGCIQLQNVQIRNSSFSNWSMGYKPLSAENFNQLEGYKNISDKTELLNHQAVENTVRVILDSFLDNIR